MDRPSPEQLLARIDAEAPKTSGHLKIFFGAAPGVGKTCAMLDAAAEQKKSGVDVVIGWLETHGRVDTEARAQGFERLPPREVQHRGILLREFDLDAAIFRKPELLLVDELPHENAPGSRHERRWQDIRDLIEAGIDVYTTLNVQHVESLNDVVAQITGVNVRETVPDAVIDQADTIEVIDLPPEELLRRLRSGKVYETTQAVRAEQGFFRMASLNALRELALRRTAERVDAEVLALRHQDGVSEHWATAERLVVAVGPSPASADLVRAASRMAGRLHAPWVAVAVELEGPALSTQTSAKLAAHLQLAEQLGGESLVVRSDSVVTGVIGVARARNATKILVGRPTHPWWKDRMFGSLVDQLIRAAEGIDVTVTTGERRGPESGPPPSKPQPIPWADGALAVSSLTVAIGVGVFARTWLTLADQAMLLLFAVVITATRATRRTALLTTVAAVAAVNWFFVPPFYTFAVADTRNLFTFLVMLVIGAIVSQLTIRVREQAEAARRREERTAILYALSRDLSASMDVKGIAQSAAAHLPGSTIWRVNGAELERVAGVALPDRELAIAKWALEHHRPAGAGTDTLPSAGFRYLPLTGTRGCIGIIGVPVPIDPLWNDLLAVLVANVTTTLERALLAEEAEAVRVGLEAEQTRTNLLSAVSHDLRTPLTSITGAATAALHDHTLSDQDRNSLLETIRDESDRLHRLISGLLELTRLEGALTAHKEWVPIDEVIASAVDRARETLGCGRFVVHLPQQVTVVPLDPVLTDQLIYNLLENAVRYAPEGPSEVQGAMDEDRLRVEVIDHGPGLPPGAETLVFERFWRDADGRRTHGTGLGLAIAKAIVRVQRGEIWAKNRLDTPEQVQGAVFGFSLPIEKLPPEPP